MHSTPNPMKGEGTQALDSTVRVWGGGYYREPAPSEDATQGLSQVQALFSLLPLLPLEFL